MNTMCQLHSDRPRPDLCYDCARDQARTPLRLELTDTLHGHIERFTWTDGHGCARVGFRTVKPIARPEHTNRPWGQIWD